MSTLALALLKPRVSEACWRWLESERHNIRAGAGARHLGRAYTLAARRFGREPLNLTDAERTLVAAADPDATFAQWDMTDVGRLALLHAVFEGAQATADASALALETFAAADAREQQSWLRGISLLPHDDRYVPVAVDACRTNILPLFESIACENPFPVRRFPDLNFNQMVLKAVFNNIALSRIVGLSRRLNAELSRMAAAYISERRAAGRTVPDDISLVLQEPVS